MSLRDVCADAQNNFHFVESYGEKINIDGKESDAPFGALYPRIACTPGGIPLVVYRQQGSPNGTAVVTDGQWSVELCPTYGSMAVAIQPHPQGVRVEVLRDGLHFNTYIVERSGVYTPEVVMAPTSQIFPSTGISYLQGDGTPVYWAGNENTKIGPWTLSWSMGVGGGTIGFANQSPIGVVAYKAATNKLYQIVEGQVDPFPPRIAQNALGEMVAAVSGINGGFINAKDWVEYKPKYPKFFKPFYVGHFYNSSARYGYGDYPGNSEIIVSETSQSKRIQPAKPILNWQFTPQDIPLSLTLGWYVAAVPEQNLSLLQAVQVVGKNRQGKPMCVYTDGPIFDFSILPYLTEWDKLMVQAYRQQNEPIGVFESRVRNTIQQCIATNHPVIIVAGVSDRSGWLSEDELKENFETYYNLSQIPGVEGIAFFAAMRPTGLVSHPSLVPYTQAFADASPGLPIFNYIAPAVASPGVDIKDYNKLLTPNNTWTAHIEDRNNPGWKFTIEFIKGDFHFTITNPSGTDRSGNSRPVAITN